MRLDASVSNTSSLMSTLANTTCSTSFVLLWMLQSYIQLRRIPTNCVVVFKNEHFQDHSVDDVEENLRV